MTSLPPTGALAPESGPQAKNSPSDLALPSDFGDHLAEIFFQWIRPGSGKQDVIQIGTITGAAPVVARTPEIGRRRDRPAEMRISRSETLHPQPSGLRSRSRCRLGPLALLSCVALCCGCQLMNPQGAVSKQVALARQFSQRGMTAMERGDWTAAESLLAQAVKSCPSDWQSHQYYAEALWLRGDQTGALAHAEEALRIVPEDAALAVRVGEMHLAMGQIVRARELAAEALDLSPQLASAWALRARANEAAGDPDLALADYHRALQGAGTDRALLLDSAELHRRMGHPRRALALLTSLRETYAKGEEPAQVLYLEGLALAALGRNEDAIDSYTAALSRDAPTAEILSVLANAQIAAGRSEEAQQTRRMAQSLEGQRMATGPATGQPGPR